MSAKDQIKQIVDYFKREPQLKDKTDGMAEGLLLGANLADEANERSKEARLKAVDIDRRYKDFLQANDLNPGKDPELVDIRQGYETAGERISDFEGKTNQRITQNKDQSDINFSNFEDKVNSPYLNIQYPPIPFVAAKPDGVTDAQPTIQGLVNLLRATGGGNVFIPPGNFVLKSGVKWETGVSLIGTGYRSKLSVSGTIFNPIYNIDGAGDGSDGDKQEVWLEDCRFENFQLDGGGFTHTLADASGKGLFILYMKRAVFKNLWIHHTIGTGLGCDFLVDTVIEGVIAENCGRNWGYGPTNVGQSGIGVGTSALSEEPLMISNCFARNNGNYGIFVETQQNPKNRKAIGAKLLNCFSAQNRIGIGNKGSGGTMFSNVTSTKNKELGFQLTEGSKGDMMDMCEIEDNLGTGLYLGSNYVGDLIVNNVRIRRNGGKGIEMPNGPTVAENISFVNCDISRNKLQGIEIWRKVKVFRLSQCLFDSNGKAGKSGAKTGMAILSNLTDFVIESNMFLNGDGTQTNGIETGSESILNHGSFMNNDLSVYGPDNSMILNGSRQNVKIQGNGGYTEEVQGSGSLTSSYNYVAITFPRAFDARPKQVTCYSRGLAPVFATDITRFGFMARTAAENTAIDFEYVARLQ